MGGGLTHLPPRGAPGQPEPHDLLSLRRVPHWPAAPAWVQTTLAELPLVVVRRAAAPQGWVSVGVRGAHRAARFAGLVCLDDIAAMARPEALAEAAATVLAEVARPHDTPRHAGLPAFMVLRQVAAILRPFGLVWGPTGSVGFELASGVPVVHAHSDLDLLLRMPQRLARASAQHLLQVLEAPAVQAGIRIDVQLETPGGAVALAEYAGGAPHVLLRTGNGALLVEDPWADCAGSDGIEPAPLVTIT
jgi:phosphoribosyl-dephospho-CoA transferase